LRPLSEEMRSSFQARRSKTSVLPRVPKQTKKCTLKTIYGKRRPKAIVDKNVVPAVSNVKTKLYRIVYTKIAELTLEEELFVKRYSGSNEGKLRSAPEGSSYYTYDAMFSGSFSAQEQKQFAGIIEILEKEIEKHDYVEFVFDHEKKLGPINKNASTALYRIRYTLIAELTKEENAVINNPKFSGSSMFILDSAPTQLFYMDNTHLEAIVNMYGERKFERLVKILKAEIDKNEYCGCVELVEEYV
jgi:hypothetical protein